MSEAPQRKWIDERAMAFALGQLEDADEQRFRSAAADVDEYRDLIEEAETDAGHVPPALLARWPRAKQEFGALERRLVTEHLRACVSCQEELRVLGAAMDDPQPAPASRVHWWPWFGGAVLGIAATLAVMTVRAPDDAFHGREVKVVTPRAVRGAEAAAVRLDPASRSLLLAVALPADVPSGAPATLVVYDPGDALFSETDLGPASFAAGSAQVLLARERGFVAGEYRVALRVRGESAARDLGRFVIELTN